MSELDREPVRYWKPRKMADTLEVTERTLARYRKNGTGPVYVRLGKARNAPVRYLPLTEGMAD